MYLSPDLPTIQFAAKELARHSSKPTEGALHGMKHLAGYLMNYGRIIHHIPFYTDTGTYDMVVPVDSDFAGCIETKRSTSGGGIFFNHVLVQSWAKTQPTVALSTCEAEYVSANYGGVKAFSLNNVLKEVGLGCENITLFCDASSAIAVTKRPGTGRLRHLHVAYLWLQQKVKEGSLRIARILGKVNLGDVFTKTCSSHLHG